MKLFQKEKIIELEIQANRAGVSMEALMDSAGRAVARETGRLLSAVNGKRVVLLCGKGNNGGDGFVCAGLLCAQGARAQVVLTQGKPRTGLAERAFLAMPEEVEQIDGEKEPETAFAALEKADAIIDAVYGFGFRGNLPDLAKELFRRAGEGKALKIACDLPSGVECDTGRAAKGAFRADVTITFTVKKPACASYPAKEYCGQVITAPVGVPLQVVKQAETFLWEPEEKEILKLLPTCGEQVNKGDLGRLLLVCGSYGMAGACIMAARAALRCGVGLLELAVEEKLYPILAGAVPEAVFTLLPWEREEKEAQRRLLSSLERASACLVGCGLGKQLAEKSVPLVLAHGKCPLVLDADGINYAAGNPGILLQYRGSLVLTPHPGEMSRLVGRPVSEIQGNRLALAQETACRLGAVMVLKGAGTVTAAPDGKCALNSTGNPGMAKGGSGDVLAGMAASLLAQGVSPYEAAVAASYLHGKAGDLCAKKYGRRAMLPTDLIESLPLVFLEG